MLAAPDRVVYRIAHGDEEAVKRIAAKYAPCERERAQLASNLRQLLGWTDVGDDRDDRKMASNFKMLVNVWCLQHDKTHEIVVCVGGYDHIFETVVQPHPGMNFARSTLKDVLNGKMTSGVGRKGNKWVRRAVPAAWFRLPDGTSLVGLGENPTAAQVNSNPRFQRLQGCTSSSCNG